MQIPVGALVDYFSVRKLIIVMVSLCAGSCFLFAIAHNFDLLKLSRLLLGFTGAFAFVSALKLATIWFPPKQYGFLAGATQVLGMLGAAMGDGPLSVVVEHTSWRFAYFLMGSFLLLLLIPIFRFVRDGFPVHKIELSKMQQAPIFVGLKKVLSNPATWINGLFVGLLYAPTGAFGELWGPLFIHRVYNFSPEQSASVVSIIFIGWAIGSPTVGWFSDLLNRRKLLMIISAVCSLIFMSLLLYSPHLSVPVAFVLAFCFGFSNVGVSLGYVVACDLNSLRLSGISLGFTNMASIAVGAAFQPLIGWLLDLHWSGAMQDGSRFYSASDFRQAMLALSIALAVCLVAVLLIEDRRSQEHDEVQGEQISCE